MIGPDGAVNDQSTSPVSPSNATSSPGPGGRRPAPRRAGSRAAARRGPQRDRPGRRSPANGSGPGGPARPGRPGSILPLHRAGGQVERDHLAPGRGDHLVGEVADPAAAAPRSAVQRGEPSTASSSRSAIASPRKIRLASSDGVTPSVVTARTARSAGADHCHRRTTGARPAAAGGRPSASDTAPAPASPGALGDRRAVDVEPTIRVAGRQVEVGVAGRDPELPGLVGAGQRPGGLGPRRSSSVAEASQPLVGLGRLGQAGPRFLDRSPARGATRARPRRPDSRGRPRRAGADRSPCGRARSSAAAR